MDTPQGRPEWIADPLDDPAVPASADAFRGVLARHRRRQTRLLGGGLALALVAGATAGFLVGRSHGPAPSATQVAAGANPSTPRPAAPAGSAPEAASGSGGGAGMAVAGPATPATQLLLRDATDGTRVRLYRRSFGPAVKCSGPSPCPQSPTPSCMPTSTVQVEVSDDQVAGDLSAPVFPADSSAGQFTLDGAGVVGAGEPQPIIVVVGHAANGVTAVTLTTPYGTDTMAPSSAGDVALAVRVPSSVTAPAGNVTVVAGTRTVQTVPLDGTTPGWKACVAPPPACSTATAPNSSTTTVPNASVGTCTCTVMPATSAGAPAGETCSGGGGGVGAANPATAPPVLAPPSAPANTVQGG